MKPVLYSVGSNARAGSIARAMQEGLKRHGINAPIYSTWRRHVEGDVAIAYGWRHREIFEAYPQFAYWDLGYWNRHPDTAKKLHGDHRRSGHHRLAVNSWDTADWMQRGCPSDRFDAAPVEMQPEQPLEGRDTILVAGMSEKAAGTHGFAPNQWEKNTLEDLGIWVRDKRIELRGKPARRDTVEPIEDVLKRCCIAVSHHSNVAVDAMLAGIPWWACKGVGRVGSAITLREGVTHRHMRLTDVERRQLLCDIAYAQWTPDEMRSGAAWDHIKGLLK